MQCNYLGVVSVSKDPTKCIAGPGYYSTTEEDRLKYCNGDNFFKCPRFLASLKIMNANGGVTSDLY